LSFVLVEGSRGSWKAAIAGVGSAVQAVDMIMNGECVNVFSVTRPPGHHAGKELHAMKAVSNGFCLLNPVACAALYATSPISEGGPGLKRVCVIDIDVHHGNGTQDILCSTYDPRFFYVSLHAGGPYVNGLDPAEDEQELVHHLGRTPKKGIFPGRCGDSSPHDGVLNIPLGARVTSHAIGTALVTKVTKAVEKFSPELIIMSTGFDAHKNDPLGLGGLCSEDFGTLTEVICKLAHKSCSGRVLSVLEGGYGVPCCRPPVNLFDPDEVMKQVNGDGPSNATSQDPPTQEPSSNADASANEHDPAQNSLQLLDLGKELPKTMSDDLTVPLGKRLDKCHQEGFMHCVREHILALAKSNVRN
jgi:acetoin utilization deacetylase AcuC-like enzyme